MKVGPKYKIAKRLGAAVFEKTQSQKFALALARKAPKRGRAPSDYGKQLLEKQKVRISYGITERQFGNYVKAALAKRGGNPLESLFAALELRLDNAVYRLGLASTRRHARQLVAHGHVTVNGKKIRVPSHALSVGDKIAVRDGSKDSRAFEGYAAAVAEKTLPAWLSVSPKELSGMVAEVPRTTGTDVAGDLSAVLAFYSR